MIVDFIHANWGRFIAAILIVAAAIAITFLLFFTQ